MAISQRLTAELRRHTRTQNRKRCKTRELGQRRPAHLEPLEARILLAGDLPLSDTREMSARLQGLLDLQQGPTHDRIDPSQDVTGTSGRLVSGPAALEPLLVMPARGDSYSPSTLGSSSEATSLPFQPPGRQLVFVAPAVADYQVLLQSLEFGRSAEVFLLDGGADGVEQISRVPAQRRDVAAVHVLAHGSSGSLQLGDTLLSTETVASYAPQLRGWANALTTDADILLYGCNVASGRWGVDLSRI